jgi:hypothetical protein
MTSLEVYVYLCTQLANLWTYGKNKEKTENSWREALILRATKQHSHINCEFVIQSNR